MRALKAKLSVLSLWLANPMAMNIGEILIWEFSNLLPLIRVVIGLVMQVRWFQGRALLTGGIGFCSLDIPAR